MSHRAHSVIAFLVFDDMEELDFVGPYEIFKLWRVFGGPSNVITIGEKPTIQCNHGLKIITEYNFANCPKVDYLVIPGGKGTRIQIYNDNFINFLKAISLKCNYILSVCTGSFLLQKAGLLKDLNATTHWASIDRLKQFKDIKNVIEERIVKNERIWTSSGISSGIDLALEFVSFIDGDEIAGKIQFHGEYYPLNKKYSDIHIKHPKSPKYLKKLKSQL